MPPKKRFQHARLGHAPAPLWVQRDFAFRLGQRQEPQSVCVRFVKLHILQTAYQLTVTVLRLGGLWVEDYFRNTSSDRLREFVELMTRNGGWMAFRRCIRLGSGSENGPFTG